VRTRETFRLPLSVELFNLTATIPNAFGGTRTNQILNLKLFIIEVLRQKFEKKKSMVKN